MVLQQVVAKTLNPNITEVTRGLVSPWTVQGSLTDPPSHPAIDLDSFMGLSGQSFNWTELLAESEVPWATRPHRKPFQVSDRVLPGGGAGADPLLGRSLGLH